MALFPEGGMTSAAGKEKIRALYNSAKDVIMGRIDVLEMEGKQTIADKVRLKMRALDDAIKKAGVDAYKAKGEEKKEVRAASSTSKAVEDDKGNLTFE